MHVTSARHLLLREDKDLLCLHRNPGEPSLEHISCPYSENLIKAQHRLENNICDFLSFLINFGVGNIQIVICKHNQFQKCLEVCQKLIKMINIFDTNLIKVHRTILKIKVLLKAILLLVGEKKTKMFIAVLKNKNKTCY